MNLSEEVKKSKLFFKFSTPTQSDIWTGLGRPCINAVKPEFFFPKHTIRIKS